MTQTSLFFDSVSGDRIYTSAAWSQIWGALFPNGVVANNAGQLSILQDGLGTMNVTVSSGAAFVQGKFYQNDASFTVPVTTADPTNPRIDRVILRVDYTARTLTVVVKAGTPAVSPTPPSLTTSIGVTWEYSLAQVAVAAGATAIVFGNITQESTLVASNAYLSFGKVKGGANTALATLPNDTVEIVAGTNIAVSTNVATKQVTVGVSGAVPIANGGTGATTQGAAQTALGVPSTAGTGASGTWGIGITGNAATATNATQLGGLTAASYELAAVYDLSACLFSNATVTSTTSRFVPSSVQSNVGGGYDNTTGKYTAPVAGWYAITIGIATFGATSSPSQDLTVYEYDAAGTSINDNIDTFLANANHPTYTVRSYIRKCSAGDVIAFAWGTVSANVTVLAGFNATYLRIKYIH